MPPNELQHDDHIWLTVQGGSWAIRERCGDVFHLWRGYEPNIEHLTIEMTTPGWQEAYAAVAAELLEWQTKYYRRFRRMPPAALVRRKLANQESVRRLTRRLTRQR